MYNKGIYIIYMHIYINNYRLRPPLRQARGRSEASAGARLLGDRRQDPAALPPTCSPSRSHRPRCDDLACQPVHSAGVCTRECPAAISNYRQDPVVPLTPLRGRSAASRSAVARPLSSRQAGQRRHCAPRGPVDTEAALEAGDDHNSEQVGGGTALEEASVEPRGPVGSC